MSKRLFACNSVRFVAAAATLVGCSSGYVKVAPAVPERYQMLGPASATACGTLLIGPTAYNFIPAGLNGRVDRAYHDAVESVPGSTALVDVTMQDNWFWYVLGTMHCTTISGTAIR